MRHFSSLKELLLNTVTLGLGFKYVAISITETYQFTWHTLLHASVYKELDEITKFILHKEASDARICM